MGEAHTVQYDHQALEKHILDRFIYGKPVILSDIPHVAYRKDIYTTVTFNAVRRKVNPQVSLLYVHCMGLWTLSVLFIAAYYVQPASCTKSLSPNNPHHTH